MPVERQGKHTNADKVEVLDASVTRYGDSEDSKQGRELENENYNHLQFYAVSGATGKVVTTVDT
jgi:hypothetical protein